jgi:hypothetical protein
MAEKNRRSLMSQGQKENVISVDLANSTRPELEGLAAQHEMEWKHERQLWGIWVVASTRHGGHHIVTEVLFGFAIRLIQKWINLEEGKQR